MKMKNQEQKSAPSHACSLLTYCVFERVWHNRLDIPWILLPRYCCLKAWSVNASDQGQCVFSYARDVTALTSVIEINFVPGQTAPPVAEIITFLSKCFQMLEWDWGGVGGERELDRQRETESVMLYLVVLLWTRFKKKFCQSVQAEWVSGLK